MPRPRSVDWRNRFGVNWVTAARSQNPCQACWNFAAVALLESMVRIEHCVWCKRSEGDLRRGMDIIPPLFGGTSHVQGDPRCDQAAESYQALDWIIDAGHGLADPDYFPWVTNDTQQEYPSPPRPDRSSRTVQISEYQILENVEDQKRWLDTTGPIICHFDVYSDFMNDWYSNPMAYIQAQNTYGNTPGYHYMLIVGYDDDNQFWIVKNSWGPLWGVGGFGLIRYGECNIDTRAKIGISHVRPDPWTKRRLHSGNILESGYGARSRNFEVVVQTGGVGRSITHMWRNNDLERVAWGVHARFGNDANEYWGCPTMIQSTFNRNFEVVYLTQGDVLHHWYYDQSTRRWIDGGTVGPSDGIGAGFPGFIQSDYNAPGNLEIVVTTLDGRLNHWWRDNRWHDGGHFGNNVAYSGASLVQSSYTHPKTGNQKHGNLELACVLNNGEMQHWWRDESVWVPTATFGSNICSPPCMIEGQYGAANEDSHGNFELCVAADGRVQHWWRNNQVGGQWTRGATFGRDVQAVTGLVESSYGFNLEVIIRRTDEQWQHYWRDGSGWHEGPTIQTV